MKETYGHPEYLITREKKKIIGTSDLATAFIIVLSMRIMLEDDIKNYMATPNQELFVK